MSEMVQRELPEGWKWESLGSLCSKITDGTHHSPVNGAEGKYKYITAKNIKPWGLDLTNITYIDEQTHKEIYARCDVKKGDILYIKDGATTGVAIVNPLDEEFSLLSSVGVFRPKENIDSNYLRYALNSPMVKKTMLANMAGVAITRLTLTKLKAAMIPVAPLDQQKRIVAKVEELFSHIDVGVEGLKKTQQLLKQYRQSVLKAAVTGELTREWREENKDKLEPASELLGRILETRREKQKGKYKEVPLPEIENLPLIPENWLWVNLQHVFDVITDGDHQSPPKSNDGVPFLVIGNVNKGILNFNNTRFVPQSYFDTLSEISVPRKGDILYTVVGSYGIPVKVDSDKAFCVQRHIAILKPSKEVYADCFYHILSSGFVFKQATDASTGTAQKTVSLGGLRKINVPLPPIAEQHEIAKIVENKLLMVDRLSNELKNKILMAERNKQSIFMAAFSGSFSTEKASCDEY